MAKIRQLGGIARYMGQMAQRVYAPDSNVIADVSSNNWPTANQPVTPILPPGTPGLAWPYQFGQNLNYTPRVDARYTASDLQALSRYPLARICIENTKDLVCKAPWIIQLRQKPGESRKDVAGRRKSGKSGDEGIGAISKFLARPNPEHDWADLIRLVLDDVLVTDSASILCIGGSRLKELRWTAGSVISRYIDDNGFTPQPPSYAYAQLWPEQGIPRSQFTTHELIYKPRNISPLTGVTSSYLYGFSPVEQIADEIKIGAARLAYVMAFYDKGSMGNVIHVVPPRVSVDKIRESMNFINSEMSGNYANRRQWRMIPGFSEDGKGDQILLPKDPVLADVFDDIHIRKICFAFGTSAQRLQRSMNRSSAQSSQEAAEEEGIAPLMAWVKRLMDYIIQIRMGMDDYEFIFDPYNEIDPVKRDKIDIADIHEGLRTRNEVRDDRGLDLVTDNPYADRLMVTTANGPVVLGEQIVSGRPDKGGAPGGVASTTTPPKPPTGKVNGHAGGFTLVERGEV